LKELIFYNPKAIDLIKPLPPACCIHYWACHTCTCIS